MSQLASSKRSFWPKRLPAEESWSIPLLFSHWLGEGGLTPICTDGTDLEKHRFERIRAEA
jgi:hypothetical protein